MTDPLCVMELNEFNKMVGVGCRLGDHEPVRLGMTNYPFPGRSDTWSISATALGSQLWYTAKGVITRACFEITHFRAGDLRDLCRKMAAAARAAGDLPAFRTVFLDLDGATLTAECCGHTWTVIGKPLGSPAASP